MATFDFFQAAGLSYEDVVKMAEADAMKPGTSLFNTIESEFAELLGATVTKNTRDALSKKKRRVYVPYTVDQAELYNLTIEFPQWDIHFTMAESSSASLARAVYQLTIENLFDLTGPDKADLVAFGCTLNPLVTRNRKWAHVCLPIADSAAYREAILDDRSMRSIVSAAQKKNKSVPLAGSYQSRSMGQMSCSRPGECQFKARMGLMMLAKTPTNFRQVAAFMHQHECSVMVFAVPWNKPMETGIDGPFPEIDAHVLHVGEYIDLVFKNAQDLDTRFSRASYLELITRTSIVVGEVVYTKEHIDYVRGMAYYRVIATEKKFDEPAPVYRSWLNPAYRDYYSIKAFVPLEGSDLNRTESYQELVFDVQRKLLDDLIHFGMALDTKDNTPIKYRRKLRSLTSGVLLHSTLVKPSIQLSVQHYKALSMVAFTHVFMTRFATGETVKTLLTQVKRHFKLQTNGAIRVFIASVARLAYIAYDYTVDTFLTKLNDYWRAIWKTPMPVGSFSQTVGFKSYTSEQTNPWASGSFQSVFSKYRPSGFYPHLPGASELSFLYSKHVVPMPVTQSPVLTAEDQTVLERELADAIGDAESTLVVTTEQVSNKSHVESDAVRDLARTIIQDFGGYVDGRDVTLRAVVPLHKRYPPDIVHAGKSDNCIHDLYYCLERFFPGTTLIKTSQYQGDINYGPMAIMARAYKLAIDVSKLTPMRPEKVKEPVVTAHVAPNTRNTLQNTLNTGVTRNLNTPDFTDPAVVSQVWERVWAAMLKVYFIPGTQEALDSLPYIGPTFENVREWVSHIPEDKRDKLLKEDFSVDQLDMIKNQMILKAKTKPLLSQAYASAVKPAQSIVFDATGKRVAVFSPLIAEKVRRMAAVLSPKVLIMQRKSPADMSEFFCRFDHRPGVHSRKYLELDGSMFDKSQGMMAKSMHWNILSMFKLLPELLDMIRGAGSALEASSIQAGVRLVTPPERETGQFDTLDGNSDVSMAIYACFLESIINLIEFIAIMGDDVTIAIRGDVDVTALENDVARIFNIAAKYTLSDYGYFCSGFIVHLNDGLSRWVPDPVKRILDYCTMSENEEADTYQKFQSHHDLCKGIEDIVVQDYLARAIPVRYAVTSDKIDAVCVSIACRLIATLKDDFEAFKSMHSEVATKRSF